MHDPQTARHNDDGSSSPQTGLRLGTIWGMRMNNVTVLLFVAGMCSWHWMTEDAYCSLRLAVICFQLTSSYSFR